MSWLHELHPIPLSGKRPGPLIFTALQIEIYCEKLKDLLDPQCVDLSIQRDTTHGCHVMGARERLSRCARDMLDTVKEGLENRVSFYCSVHVFVASCLSAPPCMLTWIHGGAPSFREVSTHV